MKEKDILSIIFNHFGLEGQIHTIYSELDSIYGLTAVSGQKYVVKISYPGRPTAILDMETHALAHLQTKLFPYQLQKIVLTTDGKSLVEFSGYHLRVLEWIDATILADCNPQSTETRQSIGRMMAYVSMGLQDFEDPVSHRFIKWDPSQVHWIKDHIQLHSVALQGTFTEKLNWIEKYIQPVLINCPKQINYNDANDYNLLCTWNQTSMVFEAYGMIDCLDMVYTHRINELAIASAYAILYLPDPLRGVCEILAAYHELNPLDENELKVLHAQILSRLMISLTVSAINRHEEPGNYYLQITDQGAWNLFEKWILIPVQYAHYSFRAACNKVPVPHYDLITNKFKSLTSHPILDAELLKDFYTFNFKVDSEELGNFEHYIHDTALNSRVQHILSSQGKRLGIGCYNEIRPFYTTDHFASEGNDGPFWRTVHLGLDLFTGASTPVYAPLNGTIHAVWDNNKPRDYGPTIILAHEIEGINFYTLYGHLSRESLVRWKQGQTISAGKLFAYIGEVDENGGWPPHLHFQIILDLLGREGDFPGVAPFGERALWTHICPDPELLTGITSKLETIQTPGQLREHRKNKLGYNLSLSYNQPLTIQRGMYQYILDHTGRRFLDTVNNVAHCGHEHPGIVKRGQAAMGVLNTNTRYLHENILQLADEVTSRLHPSLSICYFTNSGTEANELAIRLAKNYTHQNDILTIQWGYHGNSELMINLSSYKFDRKGGSGKPPNTHVIPMPDAFRGIYSGASDPTSAYIREVQRILDQLKNKNLAPVGLFAESILSCGGQVVYPTGFLAQAVNMIREAGGIYVADEVQTGLGRTGDYFCAYELNQVIPDIVTFGKPLGNGHPIGAVVCSPKIAAAFNNGMEYFNTFGGNPVSCAIAREVLLVVSEEKLMDQAKKVGSYLKTELGNLKSDYPILADIRGSGYFLGFEFMVNRHPAFLQAKYFVERMKALGILMSTDGPDDNVIKFKPPMCFDMDNANQVLDRTRQVLKENFMRIS